MFFSASIAFTFFLTLSGIAVHSAPVVVRDFVPQACTGPDGTGAYTPLNVALPNPTGPAINPAACTNVSGIQSLVLNPDNDCTTFPLPDCNIGDGFTTEQFSDDSGNLTQDVQSVSCEADPGDVNGLTAGFQG
ncbi:hypothetical protein DFH07DRAFT_783319 [Mycena maculata]|uniref:Uncharacterized protein n=1 Tax=Mycena maculata TaxID=230809 RepID=A0AAD7HMV1_9AGAR|nr:hypothetical protein DFH07DRAFT_783319 [Mycena maculata]